MTPNITAVPTCNAGSLLMDGSAWALRFTVSPIGPHETGVLTFGRIDVEPAARVHVTPDQSEAEHDPFAFEYPLIPDGLVQFRAEQGVLPGLHWDY